MGDEKKNTPPTDLDPTKPEYILATNNKARSNNTSKRPFDKLSEVTGGCEDRSDDKPSEKKED
jgi:hypothetical protein